jgi:hypothetical protein
MSAWNSKSIPLVPLVLINGEHYAQEGNHQIYAARLLGRKTIKATVRKIKYNQMLIHARLVYADGMLYLTIDMDGEKEYFELEPHEANKLKELMAGRHCCIK